MEPGRVQINRPVPRLWERFGLKTPIGLSSMNLHVQPVTVTEPNVSEVNQLLQQDTEGTWTFSAVDTVVGTTWSKKHTIGANPGLYLLNLYVGNGTVTPAPVVVTVMATGAGTAELYRVYLPLFTNTQTFLRDVIVYCGQSFDVKFESATVQSSATIWSGGWARKIQGGDTLDVGRTTNLNLAKGIPQQDAP
jgi:hypothetical protein